jgi:hypothetical protein
MRHLRALLVASFHVCLLTVVATAQEQTLQVGTSIDRQLKAGQSHTFYVELAENVFVQLVVEQRGIDVIVKVSSPDGKSLGNFDTPNGAQGPENVSFVSTTAGKYTIIVAPLNQESPEGQYQIKIIELREATEQELKSSKNREGIKEKGVALLGEAEGLMQEIRTPQTRIRAQLQAAQMLWELDEKRATKFLNDAANGLKEQVASIDPMDQEYMNQFSGLTTLRHEILQVLAVRDPESALSFLQGSKLPTDPYGNQRDFDAQESTLELMVADQMVAKNPKRAYEIARQKLKKGYPPNIANTLSAMRQKSPELATQLANDIAGKLLQEKLLKRPDAVGLTVGLLHSCRGKNSPIVDGFERRGAEQQERLISEELCRDLFQKALQDALSFTPPTSYVYTPEREAAWGLLNGLQQLGQELNEAVNGGLASVEKKLSEITFVNPDQNSIQKIHVKMNSGGPLEEALEDIQKAPEESREQLYLQLANAAASRGDRERARQIINEHVTNPYQRRNALANLDQTEMYLAMSNGKVEDALRAIANLRSPRERANLLTQIARQIGPGYKRAAALNLLEQARGLLPSNIQAQDNDQMNALLELARAFARYDPKRAFEIVDPLIEQVNELCTAARTMEGFGLDYYKNDELDMIQGNSLAALSINVSQALATLALSNFERAKASSDRLRLPEVRLRAYLEIAQVSIQGRSSVDGIILNMD